MVLVVFAETYKISRQIILSDSLLSGKKITVELDSLNEELQEVEVVYQKEDEITLKGIENFTMYESKKNELITMKKLGANLAMNNARQVFARIPGVNVWESDIAGLQLGIGTRGLSPNRNSNFNTRQNGYDISADALGYPESYYNPPMEGVEKIAIVRGAGALLYGTQFGGMVNFEMKKGNSIKPFEVLNKNTLGSFFNNEALNYFNSFTSIGGQKGKLNYYSFYQLKTGTSWRPNSQFAAHNYYFRLIYTPSPKCSIDFDYSLLDYLAQQAGGLTDLEYKTTPSISKRSRNWFAVNWNLFSANVQYNFNAKLKIQSKTFALLAQRRTIGNLNKINTLDNLNSDRTLIDGVYQNIGNETKILVNYNLEKVTNNFVGGMRLYRGYSTSLQGLGSNGKNANFNFNNPNNLETFSYAFPSFNLAFFAENSFQITERWSITPGMRWEFIETASNGYYKIRNFDAAGNLLSDQKIQEQVAKPRSVFLYGLGTSYHFEKGIEAYANFTTNYRSVSFSDLKVENPNISVSPNMQDEKGFNFDLGLRGKLSSFLKFDVSYFYMYYDNRIGVIPYTTPTFISSRLRGNIGSSFSNGVEIFIENSILKMFKPEQKSYFELNLFVNYCFNHARYFNTINSASIKSGNVVEYAPANTLRSGLGFGYKNLKINLLYSFVDAQFSDASNAILVSDAVAGEIPSYQVVDFSLKYQYRWAIIEAGINNVLNAIYFTRRAESYPGPGIIPSDPRSFYLTLGVQF